MTRLRTIDEAKLEKHIDELSAQIDILRGGEGKTRDLTKAMTFNRLLAEHNALVAVFNCLDRGTS